MFDIQEKHTHERHKFYEKIALLLEDYYWGEILIKKAEQECNFVQAYHYILFPDGISQIVQKFEEWLDKQAVAILEEIEKSAKIRERIALALDVRIMRVLSKKALLNHSAYCLIPLNILTSQESSFNSVDMIWRYAGDKSTDFNYYSKRGLLLPVYIASKVYYFADNSKEHIKTKEFIASSLDNIINIANYKNKIRLPKIEDVPILRLFS